MFKSTRKPVQFPVGSQVRPIGQSGSVVWTVTAISKDARRIEHHHNEDTFCAIWFGISELREVK